MKEYHLQIVMPCAKWREIVKAKDHVFNKNGRLTFYNEDSCHINAEVIKCFPAQYVIIEKIV